MSEVFQSVLMVQFSKTQTAKSKNTATNASSLFECMHRTSIISHRNALTASTQLGRADDCRCLESTRNPRIAGNGIIRLLSSATWSYAKVTLEKKRGHVVRPCPAIPSRIIIVWIMHAYINPFCISALGPRFFIFTEATLLPIPRTIIHV